MSEGIFRHFDCSNCCGLPIPLQPYFAFSAYALTSITSLNILVGTLFRKVEQFWQAHCCCFRPRELIWKGFLWHHSMLTKGHGLYHYILKCNWPSRRVNNNKGFFSWSSRGVCTFNGETMTGARKIDMSRCPQPTASYVRANKTATRMP